MDEIVSEKVLACLSKYVVFPSLNDFSIQLLDIPFTRISHIQVKATEPTERILQVHASTAVEPAFQRKLAVKGRWSYKRRVKNIKFVELHKRLTS